MQYPNITQYKQAIQELESFKTLKDGIKPIMDGYEPIFASGNFAVVFKMKYQGKIHALKCFLKEIPEREMRQQKIVEYIKENPSPYFVDYYYLPNELWVDVDGGNEYSVSWMQWIEALTLGEKIKDYCEQKNKKALKELSEQFRDFALWLLDQDFAHGDLKHDNLMVKPDGSLIMVDYDGMFIPEFEGLKAIELGGKSYQHPGRTAETFNKHIDDFSILTIYLSLVALSEKPGLYKKFNDGQNIIFSSNDFVSIKKSRISGKIKKTERVSCFYRILKESLKESNIQITNIKQIVKENLTIDSYFEKLNKAKRIVENGLDALEIYYKSETNIDSINEFLKTQREFANSLFVDLSTKFEEITHNDNPLNISWWNSLSASWKGLFIVNIYDAPKRYRDFYSLSSDSKKVTIDVNNLNDLKISIILFKIKELKRFYIIGDQFDSVSLLNLNPIENLTNLEFLYLRRNSFDLKPIENLLNLKELILEGNNAVLIALSRLVNLNILIIKPDKIYSGEEWDVTPKIIPNRSNLSPISNLKNLRELYLEYNELDLRPIASLFNLKKLELTNNQAELSPISNLVKLTELNLSGNKANLNPISSLMNLTKLILWHNKTTLNPVSNLLNLNELYLGDNVDLTIITSLINLSKLYLGNNIMDLSPISKLENLKELYLSYNKADLFPISNLRNLEKLYLSNNISDLKPLTNLKSLVELYLEYNELDLSPISSLNNLSILNLNFNRANLEPLSKLVSLVRLDLGYNKLDLSPISKLKNLKELDLSSNEISNIEPLTDLLNLNKLNISCDEANLEPLASLIQLTHLKLTSDSQDLTPIKSLVNIKELDLCCRNCKSDLSPLSSLIQLTRLKLSSNSQDLTPISELVNLIELEIHYCEADLKPIASLINLSKLTLWNNKADLNFLSNLKKLLELHLVDNMADISKLYELRNLQKIVISSIYF